MAKFFLPMAGVSMCLLLHYIRRPNTVCDYLHRHNAITCSGGTLTTNCRLPASPHSYGDYHE